MISGNGLSSLDGCASKNGTLRDREQPRWEAEAHELDRMIMPDARMLQAVLLHAIDATRQPSSDLTDVAMIKPLSLHGTGTMMRLEDGWHCLHWHSI